MYTYGIFNHSYLYRSIQLYQFLRIIRVVLSLNLLFYYKQKKPQCPVSLSVIAVLKEYNLKRHYT